MGNKLITASLHGSIKWLKNCPPSWKEKARKDLTNTLSRIWTEPEPGSPIKRGIDFENTVYNILNSPKKDRIDELSCSENFKKVLHLCKGGFFQKKSKSFINVNGIEYCLYGKLDVDMPGAGIIDIKTTTEKSFKESKYKNSLQHDIYLFNEGRMNFKYVVVIFENNESRISRVKEIDICKSMDECKNNIVACIKEIEEFFKTEPEFEKMYLETYSYGYKQR